MKTCQKENKIQRFQSNSKKQTAFKANIRILIHVLNFSFALVKYLVNSVSEQQKHFDFPAITLKGKNEWKNKTKKKNGK